MSLWCDVANYVVGNLCVAVWFVVFVAWQPSLDAAKGPRPALVFVGGGVCGCFVWWKERLQTKNKPKAECGVLVWKGKANGTVLAVLPFLLCCFGPLGIFGAVPKPEDGSTTSKRAIVFSTCLFLVPCFVALFRV